MTQSCSRGSSALRLTTIPTPASAITTIRMPRMMRVRLLTAMSASSIRNASTFVGAAALPTIDESVEAAGFEMRVGRRMTGADCPAPTISNLRRSSARRRDSR